ncbi:hypothetical protein TNCV_785731 [Trichonephila clavipes]|nr:hypothetical protein TNCV_785731 [Trichonephila clavipes]
MATGSYLTPNYSRSQNPLTGLKLASFKWQTTTPQLARDLSAVSGRRISRQKVYGRLAATVPYSRHPASCVPLTVSSRKDRIEVETAKARKEPAEIMRINHDSKSKFEKSYGHETFELKGKFSNAT